MEDIYHGVGEDAPSEQMAHIAAHEDVARKYNESGRANRTVPPKQPTKTTPIEQELDGIEDMIDTAARHMDNSKKKSKPAVIRHIANLLSKNRDQDPPTR